MNAILPEWRKLTVKAYAAALPRTIVGTRDGMTGRTFRVVGVYERDPKLIQIIEQIDGKDIGTRGQVFSPGTIDNYFCGCTTHECLSGHGTRSR